MSQILTNCTADAIASAAKQLIAGNLVAFPTETVYGLGADATNSRAVARIYEVKGRPTDHPLIVHIASMDRMGDWAKEVPEYAIALARNFWPGPMTLVLKRSKLAADFVTGGQDKVGVRVPDHVVALGLLEAFENAGGKGVAAPSANRFGRVSPTTAEAVLEEIGVHLDYVDQIIDGGSCAIGVESTIIDCTGVVPKILRPGAVTHLMMESVILDQKAKLKKQHTSSLIEQEASVLISKDSKAVRVSGSLISHYAPNAKVYLDNQPKPGQGFIALSKFQTPKGVIRLASPIDEVEFANILYAALRQADRLSLKEIVVIPPIGSGIALAVRDRLLKCQFKA